MAHLSTDPAVVAPAPPARLVVGSAVALFAASMVCLLLAPRIVDPTYSWTAHTTSESAAQGVPGAWVARLGFLLFGFGVLVVVRSLHTEGDGPAAAVLHGAFGISMVAVAAFSIRPWDPVAPFDPTEDLLHSVFATTMGFAFAAGVGVMLVHHHRSRPRRRAFDAVALLTAALVPLGMSAFPEADGVLQRLMFAVAYAWYAAEVLAPVPPGAADDQTSWTRSSSP